VSITTPGSRGERGREPQPSAAVIRLAIGEDDGKRGLHDYDGAKKIGGRKRYILVDTMRLLINAVVHSAAVVDLARAFLALARGGLWGVRPPEADLG
jgi:putative transposase